MPLKRRAKITKNAKNEESVRPSRASDRKIASAAERANARASNLTFLREALNAVKAQNCTEDYSSSGHVFVAVDQAKSFGSVCFDEDDPLNLSQKEKTAETRPCANTSATPASLLPAPSTDSLLPSKSNFRFPQALESASKPLPAASSNPSPPAAHSASSSLATTYKITQALASTANSFLPGPSRQSAPAAPVAAASTKAVEALSISPARCSLVQTLPAMVSPVSPTQSPRSRAPLQPMTDSTNSTDNSDSDDGGKDAKYAKLLAKYKKQTGLLKATRQKNTASKLQLAEMKDLVVHAVAEAKKAKSGANINTTFKPDPDVNMSVAQIENISGISKSTASFAQNLALHLYGAESLREKSVKGRVSNRIKNTPNARHGISPKKLEFIYAKVRERVAMEVGAENLGQIKTLSHESVVNKAIAEKISNLRKAAKNAVLRCGDNPA